LNLFIAFPALKRWAILSRAYGADKARDEHLRIPGISGERCSPAREETPVPPRFVRQLYIPISRWRP
jgi:hypothetical protein